MSLVVAIPGLPDSKRCADWKYHPRYLDGSALPRALGMNGFTALGYSQEAPFLNAMKWASGNGGFDHPWSTTTTTGFSSETGEEAYLQIDANGYPTSLTAGNGFTGTQQFKYAQTGMYVNWNNGLAPGQTYYYPNGSHTVTWDGTGTVSIFEGGTTTNLTASGQTFDSSGLSNGILLTITSTDPNKTGDYVRNIAVVQTSELVSYQSGAIFRPEWLAVMANTKCFRAMQWTLQDNIYSAFCTPLAVSAGATSAIMVGIYSGEILQATTQPTPSNSASGMTLQSGFSGTTGTYLLQFSDGETRTSTLTNGSAAVSWTGGALANTVSAYAYIVPQLTAAPASGAKSGILTNPWWGGTGNYTVIFSDGTEQPVSLTAGSTAISWPNGVGSNLTATLTIGAPWTAQSNTHSVVFPSAVYSASGTVAATFTHGSSKFTWASATTMAALDVLSYIMNPGDGTWTRRPQTSFASYVTQGVPYEVCIAAANALDADVWLNSRIDADDNFINQLCALALATLNADRHFHVEPSNEVWNSGYAQSGIANFYDAATWGGSGVHPDGYTGGTGGLNWYGMRAAQIADLCQTACGASFDRCHPVISAQTGYPATFDTVMTTPKWSDTPQNHPIKTIATAPYWGGIFTVADATTMMGVVTPGDDFFAVLYSNTGTIANGSKSYPGVGNNDGTGWTGATRENVLAVLGKFTGTSGYMTKVNGVSYTPQLACYEWGPNFYSKATVSGFDTFTTSMMRDARMASAIDTELRWWKANVGAGPDNVVCFFVNCAGVGGNGDFGMVESPLQTISPLASAPAKMQGIQNYIAQG